MQEQRRGRKIAMTPEECDEYLGSERTCTVATVSHDGPHVTALWFVWDGECAWLYSITRSQRWTDLERDPRVAILVEAGEEYNELRGVEIHGTVEVLLGLVETTRLVRLETRLVGLLHLLAHLTHARGHRLAARPVGRRLARHDRDHAIS